jgi:hypothetical protein
VPSWNTSQEVTRTAMQLLDYRPALIVALDGANDIEIATGYWRHKESFEPGYPESFPKLAALVDDIRSGKVERKRESVWQRWLPNTVRWLAGEAPEGGKRKLKPRVAAGLPDEDARRVAAVTARNHASMQALVQSVGGEFLAVFQPIAMLHSACPEPLRDVNHDTYDVYHRAVVGAAAYPFLDLAHAFDPGESAGPTPNAVFVDQVHLTDEGNEEVARRILERLP